MNKMTNNELLDLIEKWTKGNKDSRKEVVRTLMLMKRSEIIRFTLRFNEGEFGPTDRAIVIKSLCKMVESMEKSEDPLMRIHNLLYLDEDENHKEFYNPNKTWDMDIMDMVADVVDSIIPQPERK